MSDLKTKEECSEAIIVLTIQVQVIKTDISELTKELVSKEREIGRLKDLRATIHFNQIFNKEVK